MRLFKSILVGVDFTPCSAAALREAIRLAELHDGVVRVIHVIDTQIALELEAALAQPHSEICDGLMADARRAWEAFAREVSGASKLQIDLTVDHRIQGLLNKVREATADLLVIGAFGTRRPDVGAGTVATACVRHANCDVLLVRDSHRDQFTRIVAALDFSETSRRALERAAQIAHADRAPLHVLHVFSPPWDRYHYREATPQADPKFIERYKSLLSRRTADFAKLVKDEVPILSLTCDLSDAGSHRSGIVEYADRVEADLICLGTRGRSNVRDIFLGSTAEKVLLQSQCSVLAVRPAPGSRGD
jgi:nucleotide-binding universal stress UspA family protein